MGSLREVGGAQRPGSRRAVVDLLWFWRGRGASCHHQWLCPAQPSFWGDQVAHWESPGEPCIVLGEPLVSEPRTEFLERTVCCSPSPFRHMVPFYRCRQLGPSATKGWSWGPNPRRQPPGPALLPFIFLQDLNQWGRQNDDCPKCPHPSPQSAWLC